jgi:hypothetical protein
MRLKLQVCVTFISSHPISNAALLFELKRRWKKNGVANSSTIYISFAVSVSISLAVKHVY